MGKKESAIKAGSRIDTLIGAGVRIEGSIAFSGVLRTEGQIVGDVASAEPGKGTLVVGKSGQVEGSVHAGHVIVGGEVRGDVHAADSAEVQDSARVVGDIEYRRIVVHAGGVIDGDLAPCAEPAIVGAEAHAPMPAQPQAQVLAAADRALPKIATQPAGKAAWRKLALPAVLLVAVVVIALAGRKASAPVPQAAEELPQAEVAAAKAEPPPAPAAPVPTTPAPAAPPAVHESPATVERPPVAAAQAPTGDQRPPEPVPQPKRSTAAADQVTTVRGDHPGKSADFVFVSCKEGCVLAKKKPDAAGEGSRVEVARGAKKRIAIAGDEQLRVAEGEDVEIFYQGRKVSPGTIRGGAWMRFVPYGAATAGQ